MSRGIRFLGAIALFVAPQAGWAQLPRPLTEAELAWAVTPIEASGLGAPIEIGAYRGRVLLLHAWASWCTPCIRELPALQGLQNRLADTDVVFALVAMEEERPARAFMRRSGLELPAFLETRRMPAGYRLLGLPSTWIIDREGRVLVQRHGAVDWDTEEAEALLRGIAGGSLRRPDP